VHQAQVILDLALDAGPDHLDGDFFAAVQNGRVDLGHGSGGKGLRRKISKDLRQRATELCLDDRFDVLQRQGRHAVLKFGELFDVFGGEHVGAGAHQLPELDEARSQILQDAADSAGGGRAGGQYAGVFCGVRLVGLRLSQKSVDHAAEPMFYQNGGYRSEPLDATDATGAPEEVHAHVLSQAGSSSGGAAASTLRHFLAISSSLSGSM
jgi:hypothetical protein